MARKLNTQNQNANIYGEKAKHSKPKCKHLIFEIKKIASVENAIRMLIRIENSRFRKSKDEYQKLSFKNPKK
jgi:hypothetical protein